MRRLLSPAFFVLAGLMFFLPFVAVSCNIGPLRDTLEAFAPEGEEVPQLPTDDDITLFEYTKRNNRETGPALVGIEMQSPHDLAGLLDGVRSQDQWDTVLSTLEEAGLPIDEAR